MNIHNGEDVFRNIKFSVVLEKKHQDVWGIFISGRIIT